MADEITAVLSADTSGLSGVIAQVQSMIDDGTIDRFADAIEARQAAAGGSDDDDDAMREAVMALDLVVYKNGTFNVEKAADAYYSANDPEWVTTISVAVLMNAIKEAAMAMPVSVKVVN